RDIAIQQLADGLDRTVCLGVGNNRGFLSQVLRSSAFSSGVFDTSLLQASNAFPLPATPPTLTALAALVIACLPRSGMNDLPEPWWNWRSSGHFKLTVPIDANDGRQSLQVVRDGETYTVTDNTQQFSIADVQVCMETPEAGGYSPRAINPAYQEGRGRIQCLIDGKPIKVFFAWAGDTFWVQHRDTQAMFIDQRLQSSAAQASQASNIIRAPMHGRISQIHAKDCQRVSSGQLLVTMEAMKMEHHLLAPCDTNIEQVLVQAGDQVTSGQVLIKLSQFNNPGDI
ncbi:MAG: biotin/lipoyl-containing protein, partial [Burkholderiaceae bacterium]